MGVIAKIYFLFAMFYQNYDKTSILEKNVVQNLLTFDEHVHIHIHIHIYTYIMAI